MKIKLLILTIMTISWSYSQKNFKKSDIYGKYKLELNLTDVVKSENDDLNLLEKIIVTSITNSIDRVSSEYVNITFDFKNNNSLLVSVKVEDEKEENEYIRWKTNNNKIYFDDSGNDHINVKMNNGEGYWVLENKNLVKYNDDGTKVNGISLIRI
ncbi:MAG: hypothetical protein ABGW66_05025 [Flavobacteriaceae bacterium]